jgi:hexokinase
MKKENLIKPGVRYPLGFTFSFPCKQEGLASARLTSWTKGFTCSGVVNQDVVKMLQTAIDEKVFYFIVSAYSDFFFRRGNEKPVRTYLNQRKACELDL